MNNKEYLVTALRVRDYKGNMLDEPIVVYASLDNVSRPTSYPYWSASHHTDTFSSIEKAKEFFYNHQMRLINKDSIDLNTICIKEIQYVEVEKLDVRKTKEQEELERKEKAELKRLLDKYGNPYKELSADAIKTLLDTNENYGNFNGSNPYDDRGWDGE